MPAPALGERCEHGADAERRHNLAVYAQREVVPLRRREEPAAVVNQREAAQVAASPGRQLLRAVPLPVAVAAEALAPHQEGVVEDLIEKGAGSRDEGHAG